MQWIKREPTFEFPYETYYSSNRCLINGKHFYSFFSENDQGRWTGWVMSSPHHHTESYIDADSLEDAEAQVEWFFQALGGCDNDKEGFGT